MLIKKVKQMYNSLNERENHIFLNDIDEENSIIQGDIITQTINILSTKDINFSYNENSFLMKKKRKGHNKTIC